MAPEAVCKPVNNLNIQDNGLSSVKGRLKALILLGFAATLSSCTSNLQDDKAQQIGWEDLVPEDQNFSPEKSQFQAIHSSTAAIEQYQGSTVPGLDGQKVEISGFIVPLGADENALNELMLVPYFGACIHVPAPPSNQIIYFKSDEKSINVTDLDLNFPVWATGTLFTDHTDHEMAQIGYRMNIESINEFKL